MYRPCDDLYKRNLLKTGRYHNNKYLEADLLQKIFCMRQIAVLFALLACMSLLSGSGCKKGGGNTETNLVVEIDPPNGSVQAPSIGPFSLKVTVTSAMPPNGVKIEVSAKKDDGSGSAPFFTLNINTSNSVTNIDITNTPLNVQCLVEVKVTSLTKSTNQWLGSYRYSRK